MLKKYLLAPGPTPVPPEVLLAMAQPIIHHRTPQFEAVFAQVQEGLQRLFRTREEVLILAPYGYSKSSQRQTRRRSQRRQQR